VPAQPSRRGRLSHAEMSLTAFGVVFAVIRADRRKDYGEDRYSITGMVEGRLLLVSYTYRGDRIRIISARYAEPFERRLYHERNAQN
jgi:uncharacterized DUF497 family protein